MKSNLGKRNRKWLGHKVLGFLLLSTGSLTERISSINLLIVDIDQISTDKQFLPQRSQGASQSHTAYKITLILDKASIILRQNEKQAERNHCIYLKDYFYSDITASYVLKKYQMPFDCWHGIKTRL